MKKVLIVDDELALRLLVSFGVLFPRDFLGKVYCAMPRKMEKYFGIEQLFIQ